MYLNRLTPAWKEGFSGMIADNYKIAKSGLHEDLGAWIVVAEFPHFGEREQRQSDFEVEIRWSDVETIIEKFSEVGHPKAVALLEATKLTKTIR